MELCVICQKHRNLENENLLYIDDNWVLIHANPLSNILGYFYLEPRRHLEHWSEFGIEELQSLGVMIKRFEESLRKELPVDRLYVVTISEAVRHIHVHLIPRKEDEDMRGLPLISKATAPSVEGKLVTDEEIQELIKKMKSHLAEIV